MSDTILGRSDIECDSSAGIELAVSFGLDAKIFTRIGSVYRDRCEQRLE